MSQKLLLAEATIISYTYKLLDKIWGLWIIPMYLQGGSKVWGIILKSKLSCPTNSVFATCKYIMRTSVLGIGYYSSSNTVNARINNEQPPYQGAKYNSNTFREWEWYCVGHWNCLYTLFVRGYEKRDHITHFLNFHLKTLTTWKA